MPAFGGETGDGEGADVVIEAAGTEEAWQRALELVRPGGTVLYFGGRERGAELRVDAYRLHYEELTLRGAFHHAPRHVRAALAFLASGAYPWERLVTHRVGLEGVRGAARRPAARLPKAPSDFACAYGGDVEPTAAPGRDGRRLAELGVAADRMAIGVNRARRPTRSCRPAALARRVSGDRLRAQRRGLATYQHVRGRARRRATSCHADELEHTFVAGPDGLEYLVGGRDTRRSPAASSAPRGRPWHSRRRIESWDREADAPPPGDPQRPSNERQRRRTRARRARRRRTTRRGARRYSLGTAARSPHRDHDVGGGLRHPGGASGRFETSIGCLRALRPGRDRSLSDQPARAARSFVSGRDDPGNGRSRGR